MSREHFVNECLEAFKSEFGLHIVFSNSNASADELRDGSLKDRLQMPLKFLRFKTQGSAMDLCNEFRPIAKQLHTKWAMSVGVSPTKSQRQPYGSTHQVRLSPIESAVLLEELYTFLSKKVNEIRPSLPPLGNTRRFTKTRSEPIRSSSPDGCDGFDPPKIKDRTIFKAQSRHASIKKQLHPVPENTALDPVFDCEQSKRKHAAQKSSLVNTDAASPDVSYAASVSTLVNESRIHDYDELVSQELSETMQKPPATTATPGYISPVQVAPKRRKVQDPQRASAGEGTARTYGPDSGFCSTAPGKGLESSRPLTQYRDVWGELSTPSDLSEEEWQRETTEQDEQEFLKVASEHSDAVAYPDLSICNELAEDSAPPETGNFTSFSHQEPQVTDWDEFSDAEATNLTEISHFGTSGPETPKSDRMRTIRSAPTTPIHQPNIYESGRSRISYSAEPFPALRKATFETLEERLDQVFPEIPTCLSAAEFAIRWEVIRAALHCKVEPSKISLDVSQITSQNDLIAALRKDPLFKGKKLPPPSHDLAFEAARTRGQARGQAVIFSAKLAISEKDKGPLFYLSLDPLHLECGNRLIRRFGADRFLNLSFPYLRNKKAPRIVQDTKQGVERVIQWLADARHSFLDRSWSAFFTNDKKENQKGKVSPDWEWFAESSSQAASMSRVVLFAEDGPEFTMLPGTDDLVPPKEYAMRADMRVYMSRETLIDWAIEPWHPDNQKQPALKLFSRLALSLSSTFATVILKPHQIIDEPEDVLSPTGEVMNDGIGTMSKLLAADIAQILGLGQVPCGYQGRIGSAKGLWIVGTENPKEHWIKTYPSQRKWACRNEDDDHRTFEVLSEVRPLRSSGLNMQFIPVLFAQSIDPGKMKKVISRYLKTTMEEEMLVHKAMNTEHPAMYLQWVQENPSARFERIAKGTVEFLGGLPRSQYEATKLLLAGGFQPLKQRFLFDLVESLVKKRSDRLKERLKISIPQSTYAYMVADFSGVLEEGQVHMGFSQSFRVHAEESITLLHDLDALVARSPAHFPSDIQRVKLVYHPSLRHLEDVIVFSTRGNKPLADLLSGGDYDGDKAWVCWDPEIVENFRNAEPPPKLELGLQKDKTSFKDLANKVNGDETDSITLFLDHAFNFNMHESMLGICTRFKEDLCYDFNSVSSPEIIALSTLLGLLVDQTKQGYIFNRKEWDEFRNRLGLKSRISQPQYRGDKFTPSAKSVHILDYLKFEVAIPSIREAMELFESRKKQVTYYDQDLTKPHRQLEAWCESPKAIEKEAWRNLRDRLSEDILKLLNSWSRSGELRINSYAERVEEHTAMLASIRPLESSLATVPLIKDILRLDQPDLVSPWGRLKASKLIHMRQNSDVAFRLAGAQLQSIKAMEVETQKGGAIVYMTSDMYAVHQPDRRVIMGLWARDAAAGHADTVAASQIDACSRDAGMGDDDIWGLLE